MGNRRGGGGEITGLGFEIPRDGGVGELKRVAAFDGGVVEDGVFFNLEDGEALFPILGKMDKPRGRGLWLRVRGGEGLGGDVVDVVADGDGEGDELGVILGEEVLNVGLGELKSGPYFC